MFFLVIQWSPRPIPLSSEAAFIIKTSLVCQNLWSLKLLSNKKLSLPVTTKVSIPAYHCHCLHVSSVYSWVHWGQETEYTWGLCVLLDYMTEGFEHTELIKCYIILKKQNNYFGETPCFIFLLEHLPNIPLPGSNFCRICLPFNVQFFWSYLCTS